MNIEDAIAKRDAYIKERPHLQEFQNQIDDALDKCAEEDRPEVLMILLAGKMAELRDRMNELQELVDV
jgi:hypothetical protein